MRTFSSYFANTSAKPDNFRALNDCLTFTNNNGKCFPLLYEHLEEALKHIWIEGQNIDTLFKGNWTYDENKYRQGFGEALKRADQNSVQTLLGSQTPNTIKALALYSGFLLNSSPNLESDDFPNLRQTALESIFTLEPQFLSWVKRTQTLKDSSLRKYTNEAGKFLTKILKRPFYSISTIEGLDLAMLQIESSEQFNEVNTTGKGMYSRPVKLYRDFLTTLVEKTVIPSEFKTPATDNQNLSSSLLTKPFTILTGASGTGKTKLAESLATYLSNRDGDNSSIVAVGADWTDNRNVLGFVNHLRTDETTGYPSYQTTPVLELLLRAGQDPNTPYFLILDEMNLSHVERYFSDFLSVMEQKDGQFDLHSEGPASDQDFRLPVSGESKTGVPQKLDYPQNLFVIGTVNIDETTYMFSPKVLDRANVIEFKVGRDDLGAFLEKPGAYPETQPAASGVAESFLELAKKTRAHQLDPLPDSVRDSVSKHLLTLFDLLRNERFEFAYRTAKEITLFLQVSRELAKEPEPWDNECWQEDLDTQILQKILPKLHGSIGRIAPLITALSHYCESGETSGAPSLRDLVNSPFNEEEKAKALFSRSAEKLREMAKTLSSEQFVSFIS